MLLGKRQRPRLRPSYGTRNDAPASMKLFHAKALDRGAVSLIYNY